MSTASIWTNFLKQGALLVNQNDEIQNFSIAPNNFKKQSDVIITILKHLWSYEDSILLKACKDQDLFTTLKSFNFEKYSKSEFSFFESQFRRLLKKETDFFGFEIQ